MTTATINHSPTPDLFASSAPVPTAPDRSYVQRREALDHANEIRSRRAQLKRDLKAGRASLADQVADPPTWLQTAKIYHLLLCLPKVGRVKANKVLTKHKISPSKTFGGLSERQRHELMPALDPYALTPALRLRGAA